MSGEGSISSLLNESFLLSLEKSAKDCALNLMTMLEQLRTSLHSITDVSLQNMALYKQATENVSDSVVKNVNDMAELIKKIEELNQDLKAVEPLATDIKEVRKALDLFELQFSRLK